jgi:hypothetical protein
MRVTKIVMIEYKKIHLKIHHNDYLIYDLLVFGFPSHIKMKVIKKYQGKKALPGSTPHPVEGWTATPVESSRDIFDGTISL